MEIFDSFFLFFFKMLIHWIIGTDNCTTSNKYVGHFELMVNFYMPTILPIKLGNENLESNIHTINNIYMALLLYRPGTQKHESIFLLGLYGDLPLI